LFETSLNILRGIDESQDSLFSYGCLEERVPASHPLRPIRKMADEALTAMHSDFAELYSPIGRPSIPPEQQLRALLVMVLYSIRSERRLLEELNYNLLYRWFVGLGADEAVWDVTVFTKNQERFLDGGWRGSFSMRRWSRREPRR
jgi:transposase